MKSVWKISIPCLLVLALLTGIVPLDQPGNHSAAQAQVPEGKSKKQGKTAFVLFQIGRAKPGMFVESAAESEAEYQRFRRTQIELIRCPMVCRSVLRKAVIKDISFLKDLAVYERAGALRKRLQVRCLNDSEIVKVSITGDESEEELIRCIKAFADSYMSEIVQEQMRDQSLQRAALRASHDSLSSEIQEKTQTYVTQARVLGTKGTQVAQTDRELLMVELSLLMQRRSKIQEKIMESEIPRVGEKTDEEPHANAVSVEIRKVQVKQLGKDIEKLTDKARELGRRDANMLMLAEDLKQLREVNRLVEKRLALTRIEQNIDSPHRIRIIQHPVLW